MHPLASSLLSATIATLAIPALAQSPHYHHHHGHDRWRHDVHRPDVALLDRQADQLARVTRRLRQEACRLSQDYHHSAAIAASVDNIDRLQQHLHDLLHGAARSGACHPGLFDHVRSDVRQVKSWLHRLYMELSHQQLAGVRDCDRHRLAHMQRIIVHEAFPPIRRMETELDGHRRSGHQPHHSVHRIPTGSALSLLGGRIRIAF